VSQFAAFLDFVLEMRKDLCNNKTKLTKHDILLNLTQSEDEEKSCLNKGRKKKWDMETSSIAPDYPFNPYHPCSKNNNSLIL